MHFIPGTVVRATDVEVKMHKGPGFTGITLFSGMGVPATFQSER